jgi:hypothetical protein
VTWLVDAKLERVPNVYSYVLQNWVVSKLIIKLPGGYRIKIWFCSQSRFRMPEYLHTPDIGSFRACWMIVSDNYGSSNTKHKTLESKNLNYLT